jgi:putative endonuclease
LYYTGVTNNVERRLWEHENGIDKKCFTYRRRPLVLKYCDFFTNINQAISWEKQIKGWNRKKKEALFNEDWPEIKRLAGLRASDRFPYCQSEALED